MTFDEWIKHNDPAFVRPNEHNDWDFIEQQMRKAWNAALETKKEVSVGFNPIPGDWYVFSEDLEDDLSVGHYTKKSALDWADKNGYRVIIK